MHTFSRICVCYCVDIYQWTKEFYESVTTEKLVIGKSVFGRDIFAVKIGEGEPVGIVQYAIHGREYITARLARVHYEVGTAQGSCWLLPLVNPDGALLAEVGLSSIPKEKRETLLALNGGKKDFFLWKANGNGVDLNVNFAARWGKGEKNVRAAGRENYIGKTPFSEPETRALRTFTEKVRPAYTVSYHTKGEEIYWYFYQPIRACCRDKRLALALSESTGYPLRYARGSVGGYKDWCIQRYGIPAFTIEAGKDVFSHPLGEREFVDVAEKNRYALYRLSEEMEK